MANPASPLIHTYYLILLDVAIGVCFLVVLKVGMVFGMAKLATVLRDDDPAPKSTPSSPKKKPSLHLPGTIRALWVGLSVAWMLSALIQINPQFLFHAHPSSRITGSFHPAVPHAPVWFASGFLLHPMAWNVLSVMVQFGIGVLLWTGRGRSWGRIVAATGVLLSLVVWVANGFGGTFQDNLGFLGGWPGPGLLMALALAILLIRDLSEMQVARYTRVGLSIFWVIAAVEEVLPSNRLWSATGMRQVFQTNSSFSEPTFITSTIDSVAKAFIAAPVLWNAIVVAILLLLALFTLLQKPLLFSRVLATAFLVMTWWVGQNLGLNVSYALSINTAPLLLLFVWMPYQLGMSATAKGHQRPENGEDVRVNRASV